MATTLEKAYGSMNHAKTLQRPESSNGDSSASPFVNVGEMERLASFSAGAVLTGVGLARRDLRGLLIAGIGSALVYRGVSGIAMFTRRWMSTRPVLGLRKVDHGV